MHKYFFSHESTGTQECQAVQMESQLSGAERQMMLYHGPSQSGKSSIALQYAFQLVKEAQAPTSTSVVLVLHSSTKQNPLRIVPIQPCSTCQSPVSSQEDMLYWQQIRIK